MQHSVDEASDHHHQRYYGAEEVIEEVIEEEDEEGEGDYDTALPTTRRRIRHHTGTNPRNRFDTPIMPKKPYKKNSSSSRRNNDGGSDYESTNSSCSNLRGCRLNHNQNYYRNTTTTTQKSNVMSRLEYPTRTSKQHQQPQQQRIPVKRRLTLEKHPESTAEQQAFENHRKRTKRFSANPVMENTNTNTNTITNNIKSGRKSFRKLDRRDHFKQSTKPSYPITEEEEKKKKKWAVSNFEKEKTNDDDSTTPVAVDVGKSSKQVFKFVKDEAAEEEEEEEEEKEEEFDGDSNSDWENEDILTLYAEQDDYVFNTSEVPKSKRVARSKSREDAATAVTTTITTTTTTTKAKPEQQSSSTNSGFVRGRSLVRGERRSSSRSSSSRSHHRPQSVVRADEYRSSSVGSCVAVDLVAAPPPSLPNIGGYVWTSLVVSIFLQEMV